MSKYGSKVIWRLKQKLPAILTLGMMVLLAGCGSSAAPEKGTGQVVELKLAHFFPSTHPAETDLIQPWAKRLKRLPMAR